jgi:hypothetical protein
MALAGIAVTSLFPAPASAPTPKNGPAPKDQPA